jgi:hypothetical protein
MATKVIRCNCTSQYQDETYGKGNRLANEYAKGYRCTVCGRETKSETDSKSNG